MAEAAAQPTRQFLRAAVAVVDSADEGIFLRNPPSRDITVFPAGRQQLLDGVAAVDRHEAGADGVIRRMQGNRQGELKPLVHQAADAVDQAAGGQRYMPQPDLDTARTAQKL